MPLAVDPAHPFPYISGLSLNLSVRVRNSRTGRQEFARVKVPQMLPRFVRVDPGERSRTRGTSPSRSSSPTTSATCSPAWRSSTTTCSASPATRTSRSRRTRPRTSSRRSRRSCCAPVRSAHPLEISDDMDVTRLLVRARRDRTGGSACPRRSTSAASTSPGSTARAALPAARAHDGAQLQPSEPNLRADVFAAVSRKDVRCAPPVRVVRDERAGVPRAGRRRPRRARHQADPLPHLGRQPHRRGAHRRGRVGQAGARPRRDQGPVRRAGEHHVGAQAREGRRARGLRPGRAEDPLQARARHPPGEGGLRHYSHIGTGNYNPKTSRIYETSASSRPTTRSART